MTTTAGGDGASRPTAAEQEALRRRLYRPDATAADVAAFAAAAPPETAEAPLRPSSQPRRGRPRALVAPVAALALVLLVVVALQPAVRDASSPSPTASGPAAAVPSDPERAGFVARLTQGRQAGISAWLDGHADRLPGALAQATRSDTLEFSGAGSAVLPLAPPSIGDDDGGRVTVLVVLTDDATATWSLLGPPDARPQAEPQSASGPQDAGALTAASVSYPPGGRPERLRVLVPDGVRWGAAAVFSD